MACAEWSPDLCVDGSPSRSSEYSSTYQIAYLFDDDDDTRWGSDSDDIAWVQYDFGSGVAWIFTKLKLTNFILYEEGERAPRGFVLRASNTPPSDRSSDGDLLLTVAESGDYWNEGTKETKEWEFSNVTAYRYVWIYMTDKQGDYGKASEYIIAEMQLFRCLDVGFQLAGTVKEKGVAVERTVRCYKRSDGTLYDTGQSNPDGTFTLNAPDGTTEMYVIALDNDAGEDYNALIYDRVKGVEV